MHVHEGSVVWIPYIILFNSEMIEGSTQHSCYDIQIVYFVVHGISKSIIIIMSLYKQYYNIIEMKMMVLVGIQSSINNYCHIITSIHYH